MAKPNRKHRAAKLAARQGGAEFWAILNGGADRPPTAQEIGNALVEVALQTVRLGNSGAVFARTFGAQLAGEEQLAAEIAHGAGLAGQRVIAAVFENGWLPADVWEAARRRVDEFATGLLLDSMAAYIEPFARESVDETWLAQLEDIGARTWWSREEPHFEQWATRQMLTREEALTTVVEALALLVGLPKMERIRALPGKARPRTETPHHIDEKALSRVRGLLAKAESTSFPEEAEALSAKAQELMTKYALDRVLVEADAAAPDLPGARRIWLDTPYVDAKALLIDVVATANRCRAIFASDWGFVTIVGDDADLDAVELLSTSLLVQATRAMIASGNKESRSEEARSRAFRKAFLVSYATRIGERLAAATAATIAESAAPERLLPVLASHEIAVNAAFEALFPRSRSRGIAIRSAEGWDAGRAAADRARLDSRRPIDK
ncbi:DUF2786 domain-containing protein [Nocardia sp. NPDC057668]|uniref:DUF2786 domain-containing protein n=1 Tax=Nocardia sp. NPDC057668 TaxID=3346202 RepID=UPI00366E80D1